MAIIRLLSWNFDHDRSHLLPLFERKIIKFWPKASKMKNQYALSGIKSGKTLKYCRSVYVRSEGTVSFGTRSSVAWRGKFCNAPYQWESKSGISIFSWPFFSVYDYEGKSRKKVSLEKNNFKTYTKSDRYESENTFQQLQLTRIVLRGNNFV